MATSQICSIPDCGKPVLYRGICNAHYKRLRRHGDPMGGTQSKGFALDFIAKAIQYDGEDCLEWPFSIIANGYGSVGWNGRTRSVHRLVCELTHGEAPVGMQAAHECGNRACCSPKHLSWKTRADNMQDMVKHGRSRRGKKNAFNRHDEATVRRIRALQGKLSHSKIKALTGVSLAQISRIQTRKSWGWLDG